MWPGTSPSIAATPDGNWEVAFEEASTGNLWSYGSRYGGKFDHGLGMQNTSSPSITGVLTGGFQIRIPSQHKIPVGDWNFE